MCNLIGYSGYNNKQQKSKVYPWSDVDNFLREDALQKNCRGTKCASDVTGDIDVTVVRFSVGSRCATATEQDIKWQPAVMAGAVSCASVTQSVGTFSNRLSKITSLISKSSL